MPIREQDSHKGTFGKVLNVAGSENYIGAAYLSTLASLKIGAGYAALSSCKKVLDSVSKLLPEAVLLSRKDALKKVDEFTTMLIGCGLSQGRNSKTDFKKFIELAKKFDLPTVIDADGLNILSKENIVLPTKTIITPHPKEAARLLGVDDITSNLEFAAKELSKKYKCVVVLKNHRTIICEGDTIFINQHGNSALAKAGTGDVLAGIISGLLAQRMTPYEAAKLGVYLHSRAGEIASKELTEYSVLASVVIKYLPQAIKEILNNENSQSL
ncbi:NAD(P)H-hydrate dehydratase [bacterium]|nr:NAD(P)H-hydrate dehydratase [bacterium]